LRASTRTDSGKYQSKQIRCHLHAVESVDCEGNVAGSKRRFDAEKVESCGTVGGCRRDGAVPPELKDACRNAREADNKPAGVLAGRPLECIESSVTNRKVRRNGPVPHERRRCSPMWQVPAGQADRLDRCDETLHGLVMFSPIVPKDRSEL